MSSQLSKRYRDKPLTFEQFRDLTIIGMSGLTDDLMDDPVAVRADGMINYRLVANALGLSYEDAWIDRLKHELENGLEAIVSHDTAPTGTGNDGYWAYLNSGFERLASLLFEKYYPSQPHPRFSFEEFRDVLLFEWAGLVQDGVAEDGRNATSRNQDYDLWAVANHFNLIFSTEWLDRAIQEWLAEGYIVSINRSPSSNQRQRYRLTHDGYDHATSLSEIVGAADGPLLRGDSGKLYFSVDASHISRLGMELVAKQETAVAELVKNGYDADATNVDLIINTANDPTSLEIYDNGSGMDIAQLDAGFMRLSTTNKIAEPRSPKFKRQKAGRKGIGRFAAQRLGLRLILETCKEDLHYGLRLEIDWEHFEANLNLSAIPNSLTRIEKPFPHGTRLTILHLRDGWSVAQIERSYRHIAELIQPFPLAKTQANEGGDPGFKASFAREVAGDLQIVADDWSTFFQHALAEIDGQVDNDGRGSWSVKSSRFGIDTGPTPIGQTKEAPAAPFPHLRNVRFKAYYYIDKETQHSFRAKVAEKLQSSGGIRLYRNGFRVLPYGERYDDWLKLNASNLLRKVLPPHSNRNFLGFVEIHDVGGTSFEETSSREGLLENESFVELKDFVSSALKTAILPIAEARDRRLTTTDTRQKGRSPKGQAEDIIARLGALQKSATENPEYAAAFAEVLDSVRQSVAEIGATGEALLEELGMMRVLASLGLTIGEFTHEIRLSLEAVKASASLLASNIDMHSESGIRASALLDQMSDFEGYLTYFDATVRDNVSREVHSLEIRDVVNSFIKVVSPKLNRNELTIEQRFNGFGLFMKPMHKSEWASILINLFTNSLKAIRRAGVKGHIRIECGRLNDSIYLDFMDNGDGIPPSNTEKIFNAFFTTTSATGASEDDGTFAGMGMGLKIVRDIVETAQGQITLRSPSNGFATCFRVTIPEATDEEIPENAY